MASPLVIRQSAVMTRGVAAEAGNRWRTRSVQDSMRSRLLACSLAALAVLAACGDSAGEADNGAGIRDAETPLSDQGPADSASEGCVSEYSAETLRKRAFAFDGTVVDVGTEKDPRAPEEDVVTGRAHFEVHEWFAGGTGEAVTVWMQRPVEEGDRLLVAGEPRWGGAPLEEAIAWECGFTAAYSDARSREWSAAFADG